MPRSLTRPLPVAILLGLVAQALFTFRLGTPSKLVFDEFHYVPAARALLALSHPVNTEHPLLGKELIALGMMLFGDNAIGWRALSTVSGTATVLGVYAITWRLFGSVRTAAFAVVMLLLNFFLFIQARIAMLDAHMAAFVVLAVAAILWGMREYALRWWTVGSALLGLAVAVKWAAAPYVAFTGIAFLLLRRGRPDRWPGLPPVRALTVLGTVSVSVYFLTFIPAFFYATEPLTLSSLVPIQLDMYLRQTQVLAPHTYQSDWWSWPLQLRAIWYFYEPADGAQRGILFVGNPAVMWAGLLAVAYGGWALVRRRDHRLGAPALLWLGSYGIWAAIPKSLGFLYYYYLPSLWLPIAIAGFWHTRAKGRLEGWDELHLAVAAGLFLYFYPIIAATALSGPGAFHRWTWFPGWV